MTLLCRADGEATCTVSCKRYRDGGEECRSIPSTMLSRGGRAVPRVLPADGEPVDVGIDIFRPRETVNHPCIVEPVTTWRGDGVRVDPPPVLHVEPFAIGAVLASWEGAAGDRFNVYAGVRDADFPRTGEHLVASVSSSVRTGVGSVVIGNINDEPLPTGELIWVAVHSVATDGTEGPSSNVMGAVVREAVEVADGEPGPATTAALELTDDPVQGWVDESHLWIGRDHGELAGKVILGFDGSRIIDSATARKRADMVVARLERDQLHVDLPRLPATNFKMADMVKELSDEYMARHSTPPLTWTHNPRIGVDDAGTPVYWSDLVDENIAATDVRITL